MRLFARYGNDLTLLDAIYYTTRYSLPLFFLVAKTNTDYQIVAVFVTESKTEESIEEALSYGTSLGTLLPSLLNTRLTCVIS